MSLIKTCLRGSCSPSRSLAGFASGCHSIRLNQCTITVLVVFLHHLSRILAARRPVQLRRVGRQWLILHQQAHAYHDTLVRQRPRYIAPHLYLHAWLFGLLLHLEVGSIGEACVEIPVGLRARTSGWDFEALLCTPCRALASPT